MLTKLVNFTGCAGSHDRTSAQPLAVRDARAHPIAGAC
jgi:hypothetical protein